MEIEQNRKCLLRKGDLYEIYKSHVSKILYRYDLEWALAKLISAKIQKKVQLNRSGSPLDKKVSKKTKQSLFTNFIEKGFLIKLFAFLYRSFRKVVARLNILEFENP